MKKIIFTLLFICTCAFGYAQTSRVVIKAPARDKPILFNTSQSFVDIEGYDGDDIIMEYVRDAVAPPAAAQGLAQVMVPARQPEDTVINVSTKETTIEVGNGREQVFLVSVKNRFRHITIKVPKTALVEIEMSSAATDGKLTVNSVYSMGIFSIGLPFIELSDVGDLVISTSSAKKITLSNMRWGTEPLTVNGQYRMRQCTINTNAPVEIFVPETLKADFNYYAPNGQVISNLPVVEAKQTVRQIRTFGESFAWGTVVKTLALNGGGVNINVESSAGDIYIKKQ